MTAKIFATHLITDELSYNISRRYPFGRAFKWWTVSVFAIFTGLLTIFSLATNGFDKDFEYTTNPNSTEIKRHWYNNYVFTWGSDHLTPNCQSIQISSGYQFITTNLGFQYTVQRISVPGLKSEEQRALVSYHNNVLENCEIENIAIKLKKSDWSSQGIIDAFIESDQRGFARWSWMESDASANAFCNIMVGNETTTLKLLVKYSPQIYDHSFIASDDPISHAALWWGSRLLNAYFAGLQQIMSEPLKDVNGNDTTYTRANFDFKRRPKEYGISIQDPKLYTTGYVFLHANGEIDTDDRSDAKSFFNNESFHLSRPLTEAFMWMQIFRSAILADLGNKKETNLLTNETLLQSVLDPSREDDFNRVRGAPLTPNKDEGRWMFTAMPPPYQTFRKSTAVLLQQAFETFGRIATPSQMDRATIQAEYICSIPRKRNPLAMVMFTLVANLALFHSTWALFKYVADRRATWKKPESNWCEGCLELRVERHERPGLDDITASENLCQRLPAIDNPALLSNVGEILSIGESESLEEMHSLSVAEGPEEDRVGGSLHQFTRLQHENGSSTEKLLKS